MISGMHGELHFAIITIYTYIILFQCMHNWIMVIMNNTFIFNLKLQNYHYKKTFLIHVSIIDFRPKTLLSYCVLR